jgi:DNA-directed RNA polymerase subunit beta'
VSARKQAVSTLESEYKSKLKEFTKNNDQEAIDELKEQYKERKTALKSINLYQILSEMEYFNLSKSFGQVFKAGIGAEAIRDILVEMNVKKTIKSIRDGLTEKDSIQRKKDLKRLKFFQGIEKAGLNLEWMLPTIIPVIPPDLRPMVALDGGRFATSDLNDLYRRIINRNNRLKKLIKLNAPEVIARNEKRMLQEAVDALFDNSARRGQASVSASTGQKRALRSLADSLKGKQGRFRQNLLGKRVDYSGRSVIVIGPQLKLNQAGIPKKMALELFKPFIINKLIENEFAHNVRTAGKMVDAATEEAYEILDNIISHHYVMLNRAPTLHRLSIQAFQPVLIEGKAIQLHPMVCAAFNADFDGDQMAVHVPLTDEAREECANLMLSSKNLLKPASGEPITTPSLDMVLGVYYLTHMKENAKGEGKLFADMDEVISAYQNDIIDINAVIKLLYKKKVIETSAGRVLFNDILPEKLRFKNEELTKTELKEVVAEIIEILGQEEAVKFLDKVKSLGFSSVTNSGISWGMDDLQVPKQKENILAQAQEEVTAVRDQYNMGLLTDEERRNSSIEIWNKSKDDITEAVRNSLDKEGPVYSMIHSKARGSESVVVQMTGMKGLMAGATGETLELPVRSSYKEGLDVLEYFISTHGARKGMADIALRTATAGYLTRRLVDVAQDIIVTEKDCKDKEGAYIFREDSDRIGLDFNLRVEGRIAAENITHPKTKKVIVKKNAFIGEKEALAIKKSKLDKVKIRTAVTCKTRRGICQKCYGIDLGRGGIVGLGQSVGVVAAQAIGEPGTQLTMRTFHIGGVAGSDITQGLPRVEEIFEARMPKGESIVADFDGTITEVNDTGGKFIKITVQSTAKKTKTKDYNISAGSTVKVAKGDLVVKGTPLNEGHIDLKKLYKIMGQESVHRYIVNEIQEIYASQGESINDKHIEVIVRQMLSRMQITNSGDTTLIPGDIVERDEFIDANEEMKEKKGEGAEANQMILGITKVSLSTESFLSSASFQQTAQVLINAAVTAKEDRLRGLKENVIIGRLIPAGTGFRKSEKE